MSEVRTAGLTQLVELGFNVTSHFLNSPIHVMNILRAQSEARLNAAGFSRPDLLGTVGTISLLVAIFSGIAATSRDTTQTVRCRANLRHLVRAWSAFAQESADRVIGTPMGSEAQAPAIFSVQDMWAGGWLDWDGGRSITNLSEIQTQAFLPYVGRNVSVFKCPADNWISPRMKSLGMSYRIRSYSMNSSLGPLQSIRSPSDDNLRQMRKLTDIPKTSECFVFLEEHPDSINDPTFWATRPRADRPWIDLPASSHGGSGAFSFADGHVEIHSWELKQTRLPVTFKYISPRYIPNDPDSKWVWQHAGTPTR